MHIKLLQTASNPFIQFDGVDNKSNFFQYFRYRSETAVHAQNNFNHTFDMKTGNESILNQGFQPQKMNIGVELLSGVDDARSLNNLMRLNNAASGVERGRVGHIGYAHNNRNLPGYDRKPEVNAFDNYSKADVQSTFFQPNFAFDRSPMNDLDNSVQDIDYRTSRSLSEYEQTPLNPFLDTSSDDSQENSVYRESFLADEYQSARSVVERPTPSFFEYSVNTVRRPHNRSKITNHRCEYIIELEWFSEFFKFSISPWISR